MSLTIMISTSHKSYTRITYYIDAIYSAVVLIFRQKYYYKMRDYYPNTII